MCLGINAMRFPAWNWVSRPRLGSGNLAEQLYFPWNISSSDSRKRRLCSQPVRSKVVGGYTCGKGQLFPVRPRHESFAMSPDPPTLQMSLSCAKPPLNDQRCKSPRVAPPTGAGFGPLLIFTPGAADDRYGTKTRHSNTMLPQTRCKSMQLW
jgi:hypothetical protein